MIKSPYWNRFAAGEAILLALVLSAGAVFALWPNLDQIVAGFFFTGGRFVGQTDIGVLARQAARVLPFFLFISLSLLYLGRRSGVIAPRFAPRGKSMLFLALSLALGPGLGVSVLKDYSHRPRPVHIQEFDGNDAFRPFYRFDGACRQNCSFPSGEAAAAFWTAAPASLAPPPLRLAAMVAALIYAFATGALRMAFGGHFLSDVIFGGLMTWSVILFVGRALPNISAVVEIVSAAHKRR
jgi:membrane-associated phospholipid phosphatase